MAFNMDEVLDKVILFLIIVALVPGALFSYFNVSVGTWDASTVAIWGILGILFIVGLATGLRGKRGR